jgi:hypothetical protein
MRGGKLQPNPFAAAKCSKNSWAESWTLDQATAIAQHDSKLLQITRSHLQFTFPRAQITFQEHENAANFFNGAAMLLRGKNDIICKNSVCKHPCKWINQKAIKNCVGLDQLPRLMIVATWKLLKFLSFWWIEQSNGQENFLENLNRFRCPIQRITLHGRRAAFVFRLLTTFLFVIVIMNNRWRATGRQRQSAFHTESLLGCAWHFVKRTFRRLTFRPAKLLTNWTNSPFIHNPFQKWQQLASECTSMFSLKCVSSVHFPLGNAGVSLEPFDHFVSWKLHKWSNIPDNESKSICLKSTTKTFFDKLGRQNCFLQRMGQSSDRYATFFFFFKTKLI